MDPDPRYERPRGSGSAWRIRIRFQIAMQRGKLNLNLRFFPLQIMPEQLLKTNKKSNVSMKTLYNTYLMRPIFSFWFRIRIKADADP